jgi:hypothetical protein
VSFIYDLQGSTFPLDGCTITLEATTPVALDASDSFEVVVRHAERPGKFNTVVRGSFTSTTLATGTVAQWDYRGVDVAALCQTGKAAAFQSEVSHPYERTWEATQQ